MINLRGIELHFLYRGHLSNQVQDALRQELNEINLTNAIQIVIRTDDTYIRVSLPTSYDHVISTITDVCERLIRVTEPL